MNPTLTRRGALGAGAALSAAVSIGVFAEPRRALAQGAPATPAPAGPFTLPPLGYAYNANEPHIDAQTMELHHTRHHQAFITNLNGLAGNNPRITQMPVPELLAKIGEMPEGIRTALRNSGGGHANHTMFWEIMGGRGGNPTGEVAQAITRDLGGFDKMKTDFNTAGAGRFGSGWVFVTVARDGKLALTTRPNQDSPLFEGERVLLGNDVWEHAYYLKYQNRRPEYLAAWWNVVNWEKVGQRYAMAKAGTLGV